MLPRLRSKMNPKSLIYQQIVDALTTLEVSGIEFDLSPSKNTEFGDLSTNIALLLTKQLKQNPINIANDIVAKLEVDSNLISDVNVSPPGFINFRISLEYYQSIVKLIIDKNESFYSGDFGKGKTANVEFVSANPTGPLSVGHGRQAVLGDTVANILQWHGYNVTREYYYNDGGKQMRVLAKSVEGRYFQVLNKDYDWTDEFYQGDYIKDIAADIIEQYGNSLESGDELFRSVAEERIFENIKISLENLGIVHDVFSNEKNYIAPENIKSLLDDLDKKNLIYKKDSATWFKTTEFGKDQDRVLIKSSGEAAYRLPDILYHCDKFDRNFDLLVDIFGSDHIDAYPDVISALEALGHDTSHLKVLIHQFVTLTKAGEKVKMSTRKADFVTLDELTHLVGKDVVRYFFIMRGMNTHLNFDLELAQDQSDKNPVFYLQYAHARISNIIRHGEQQDVTFTGEYRSELLTHESEIKLIKELIRFPEEMAIVLDSLEPRGIANYLQTLATSFHKFYGNCKVISDNIELSQARMALVFATKNILAEGLKILGIHAPDRM